MCSPSLLCTPWGNPVRGFPPTGLSVRNSPGARCGSFGIQFDGLFLKRSFPLDPLPQNGHITRRNRISRRRHGTGLVVGKRGHQVEPALPGFSGNDQFPGADQASECFGIRERGHYGQPDGRVAMHTVALQCRLDLREGSHPLLRRGGLRRIWQAGRRTM